MLERIFLLVAGFQRIETCSVRQSNVPGRIVDMNINKCRRDLVHEL